MGRALYAVFCRRCGIDKVAMLGFHAKGLLGLHVFFPCSSIFMEMGQGPCESDRRRMEGNAFINVLTIVMGSLMDAIRLPESVLQKPILSFFSFNTGTPVRAWQGRHLAATCKTLAKETQGWKPDINNIKSPVPKVCIMHRHDYAALGGVMQQRSLRIVMRRWSSGEEEDDHEDVMFAMPTRVPQPQLVLHRLTSLTLELVPYQPGPSFLQWLSVVAPNLQQLQCEFLELDPDHGPLILPCLKTLTVRYLYFGEDTSKSVDLSDFFPLLTCLVAENSGAQYESRLRLPHLSDLEIYGISTQTLIDNREQLEGLTRLVVPCDVISGMNLGHVMPRLQSLGIFVWMSWSLDGATSALGHLRDLELYLWGNKTTAGCDVDLLMAAIITGDRLIADSTSIVLRFGRRIMSSTLQNKLIYPFKSGM